MLDLSAIGITPITPSSAATQTHTTVASNIGSTKALVPGSMLARVLYAAFSRQPVTVIDSPPGAGKSTLIIDAISVLMRRSPYKIVLATPTKRGAVDLAERLVAEFGSADDAPTVVVGIKSLATLPDGCFAAAPAGRRYVTIRTIASCAINAPECDIMVFDEAYQATYADVMTAADAADQVLMVGDPGQIGPVVTQNTSAWDGMLAAPHKRAPEVFARRNDALVLQMDATYRLGQPTVDAIAPLYGFEFSSRRPARRLTQRDGSPLPELAHVTLTAEQTKDGVDSILMLKRIAEVAIQMVGSTVTDAEGNETVLAEKDVAVVVSRNVQSSAIQAILRSQAYGAIAVGTADKMQGGQWHAVVALDPLTGDRNVSPFQLNLGRLCVLSSRHLTHLTLLSDGQSAAKLRAAADENPEAITGMVVRRHLTANEVEFASVL